MRSMTWRFGLILVTAIGAILPVWGPGKAWAQSPQFRAFWADAFHPGYKNTSQINDLVARAVAGNYNAIVAEVMAYQDNASSAHGAYWNSNIVPKAPDIEAGLDPLALLVSSAHAQGIEVHAWMLAYRSCSVWPPAGNPTLAAHPEWVAVPKGSMGYGPVKVGGAYQLDAGSPDMQDYIVSIVRELVTNYAIDGIHWDYIRYTQTDAGYPSNTSYGRSGLARFKQMTGYSGTPPATGEPAWNDFRRREINELIRRCRAEVASVVGLDSRLRGNDGNALDRQDAGPTLDSRLRGNDGVQPLRHTGSVIAWGDAPSDFINSSAYKSCFQDWRLWMEQGWLDAACPMLYYREYNADQRAWYRHWVDAALGWRYQRHAYLGQANYLNTMADAVTQMQYAYDHGADGTVNYSYYSTTDSNSDGATENDWSWYPYVAAHLFTSPTPLPTMPWRNPATATEGTLWGQVTDITTGLPIDDATVAVGAWPSVQTDGNGYYVVTMIPATSAGTAYDVTASKANYTTVTHTAIAVVAGDIRRDDFVLLGSGTPPPVITQHPQSQTVAPGGTATLTVVATGEGTLIYQWQKNGIDLSEGGHYAGVTTTALTISNASADDGANYRCAVSNAGGTTLSREAVLTVQGDTEEYVVESRSGGKNYANYEESGSLSDSISKSGAPGTTAGTGSRWGYMDLATYGVNKAIYSYTPPTTGVYDVSVTWPASTNASERVEHIITHRDGSTSVFLDQDKVSNPNGANKWNSLGQYVLAANQTYTVTQTNENFPDPPEIFRADAVRWLLLSTRLPQRIYSFPMDIDPGWSTEDQWAFGQPTGGGGAHGNPDPVAGHTGTNVYGYNLAGDYPGELPERHLTSTILNCTGVTQVNLRFWRWLGVEEPTYDHASVRVSNDGTTWTTLWQNTGQVADAAWTYQNLDLSAVADNQAAVYLRWTMGPTDYMWQFCGWNIDDVEVWGLHPPPIVAADFDADGDVDMADVDLLAACDTGATGHYDPENLPQGCPLTPDEQGILPADFDRDSDVDQSDFGIFQRCYSGPNQPPDVHCAD